MQESLFDDTLLDRQRQKKRQSDTKKIPSDRRQRFLPHHRKTREGDSLIDIHITRGTNRQERRKMQIPKLVFRYLLVAYALNLYMAPGSTLPEKMTHASERMLGFLATFQSFESVKVWYGQLEASGGLGILKFACFRKVAKKEKDQES